MTVKMRDFKFFRDQAGYVVGHRAEGAIALARAEMWAEENIDAMDVLPDESPDLGDHDYWCGKDDCAHEVYCMILTARDGETASLGGIIDPSDDYIRVLRAELSLELQAA